MADIEKKDEPTHVESTAPQGYRHVHIDEAVEKRVVRKLDWNLMPLVVALCKSRMAELALSWSDE
jgi:hypothetical protein